MVTLDSIKYKALWPIDSKGCFLNCNFNLSKNNNLHNLAIKTKDIALKSFEEYILAIVLRGSAIYLDPRYAPLDLDLLIIVREDNPVLKKKLRELIVGFLNPTKVDLPIITLENFRKSTIHQAIYKSNSINLYEEKELNLAPSCIPCDKEFAEIYLSKLLNIIAFNIKRTQSEFQIMKNIIRLLTVYGILDRKFFSRDLYDCVKIISNYDTAIANQALNVLKKYDSTGFVDLKNLKIILSNCVKDFESQSLIK